MNKIFFTVFMLGTLTMQAQDFNFDCEPITEIGITMYYVCSNCEGIVGEVTWSKDHSKIAPDDTFTSVNGIALTVNNYQSLIYNNATSIYVGLSVYQNNTFVSNGETRRVKVKSGVYGDQEINIELDIPVYTKQDINIGN